LDVLERGDRDQDNETGLKEEGGIEMSIYSAFHIRDARSLSLCNYLPAKLFHAPVYQARTFFVPYTSMDLHPTTCHTALFDWVLN